MRRCSAPRVPWPSGSCYKKGRSSTIGSYFIPGERNIGFTAFFEAVAEDPEAEYLRSLPANLSGGPQRTRRGG